MLRPLPLVLALAALPSAAFAHRLDEYLQATLVSIEPDAIRLHINLTPGVAVADVVLALIDRDHDGAISPEEAAVYADLLKRDLTLRVDGREVQVKLAASKVPEPADFQTGSGVMQVEFSTAPGVVAAGAHRLTLENRHLPAASAYLFNAARPRSGAVEITEQARNQNQSEGEIEFAIRPASIGSNGAARVVGSLAAVIVAVLAMFLIRHFRFHRSNGLAASVLKGSVTLRPVPADS